MLLLAIKNTVSSDFDPRSSIVKSVFDCRLSDVIFNATSRQTDEDDSGFRTVIRGYTYDHETSAIRLTATLLKKYAKNLETLQKDIRRKEQKTTSEKLPAKKKEYETCLSDIQHELRELNRVSKE